MNGQVENAPLRKRIVGIVCWTIAYLLVWSILFLSIGVSAGDSREAWPGGQITFGLCAAALAVPVTLWWRHQVVNKARIVAERHAKEEKEYRAFAEDAELLGEDAALLKHVGPLLVVGIVLSIFVLTAPRLPIGVALVSGGLIVAGSILWNRRTPPEA